MDQGNVDMKNNTVENVSSTSNVSQGKVNYSSMPSGNNAMSTSNNVVQRDYAQEYKPIGAWGYVGYNILFSIPLVGFILMLVFAFGGTANVNLRNYARSFLLGILLMIIPMIFFISVIVAGMSFS